MHDQDLKPGSHACKIVCCSTLSSSLTESPPSIRMRPVLEWLNLLLYKRLRLKMAVHGVVQGISSVLTILPSDCI